MGSSLNIIRAAQGGVFFVQSSCVCAFVLGAAFLLAIGSFPLTMVLIYLQLCLRAFSYSWSFCAYSWSFLLTNWSFLALSGKVHLLRTSTDSKQQSSTVSKKTPSGSKKAFPFKMCIVCRHRIALLLLLRLLLMIAAKTTARWLRKPEPSFPVKLY